jgi:hypothetical protein
MSVAHVAYTFGVVVPLVEARGWPDHTHVREHPHGELVFRARTHLYEPVPPRRKATVA